MTIRIDPDTMNQRANQYRTEAQNVGQVIQSMDNLLGTLQTEWEGSASQSYKDRYEGDLKPAFLRAQQLIDEIATALDKTAQQMREQDAAIASGFQA